MNKISRQLKSPVGFNNGFLHPHPGMESKLSVDEDHVIVDRYDWLRVIYYLNENEDVKQKIINEKREI